MDDFSKNILEQMLSIGFRYLTTEYTEIGYSVVYTYHPNYLENKHYTLVLFSRYEYEYPDHRLYIHNNSDGSFVDSLYQIGPTSDWYRNYLNKKIKETFKSEIRDIKLKSLC